MQKQKQNKNNLIQVKSAILFKCFNISMRMAFRIKSNCTKKNQWLAKTSQLVEWCISEFLIPPMTYKKWLPTKSKCVFKFKN